MKKVIICTILFLYVGVTSTCRNTISNNTDTTFKVAEVKKDNADLKQQIFLPTEYEADEELAHTIKPGEEVDFGGHYVPTFIIYRHDDEKYKLYNDDKWHPILIVKQLRCGPRGPENKYLLITDILKQKLHHDYQPVYKFTIKASKPAELELTSTNEAELNKVSNPYQECLNIVDDFMQKLLELIGRLCPPNHQDDVQASQQSSSNYSPQPTAEPKEAGDTNNKEESHGCAMCTLAAQSKIIKE